MKSFIFKSINICSIAVFLWIIVNSFFQPISVYYNVNQAISFLAMFFLFALLYYLYKKINKTTKISLKKEIIIVLILFLIIILLQIFVFKNLGVNPGWDYGVIFKNAENYALHNDRSFDEMYYEYFSLFPNNIFIFILCTIAIRLGSILNLSSLMSCVIMNIIFIDIAILLFYIFIRKITGNVKKAIFALVLIMCFLPLYLYTPIFYSDTLSMPFVILIPLLFSQIDKNNTKSKNVILILLLGICCFLGKEIKITSLFILLALFLVILFEKGLSKKILIFGIVAIEVAIISIPYKYLIVDNEKFDFNAGNIWGSLPYTHWIMMGVEDPTADNSGHNSYGGYNDKDYEKTKSFATKQQAIEFNISETITRIKKYGFFGYIDYLSKKLVNAWGDGLYFSNIKLNINSIDMNNKWRVLIDTSKTEFKVLLYFAQGIQVMFLLSMILTSIYDLKYGSYNYLRLSIKLAILGLMLFLLMWENRSRYLLNYIPLYSYIIFDCFEKADNIIVKIKEKRTKPQINAKN